DSWEGMTTTDAPGPRESHVAVWTGSRMIVWGGEVTDTSTTVLSTGGQYDPVADTWTATTTTGAPAGSSLASVVWAGSVMIVWGGSASIPGGRYDPVADHWTSTSTVGAPTDRRGQTAVWSGSEMIVWGGQTPTTLYLLTGGRYNPVTDTWTPTDVS